MSVATSMLLMQGALMSTRAVYARAPAPTPLNSRGSALPGSRIAVSGYAGWTVADVAAWTPAPARYPAFGAAGLGGQS